MERSMRIHDTLSRKTVELEPRERGRVSLYVCGVTPYAPAHVGHARTAVVYDVLKRHLVHAGYEVRHVSNYTDIDDKIIRRARENNEPPLELSARFIREYQEDMIRLNIVPPDVEPRVSESIGDIIDLISLIVANGYAYVTGDGVYFAVRKFEHYGRLSGRSVDEMRSGARVEVNESKDDPLDFALWKFARPGEISWVSPWGEGRPGWHIECSAMSLRYLGAGFDIHGGGEDLIFPHHENEIAQSEAALGPGHFAKYWLHSGLVTMSGEKMSKSLGNITGVRELLAMYPGQVLRLFLLQTSYEKPLKFSLAGVEQAFGSYERIVEFAEFLRSSLPNSAGESKAEVRDLAAKLQSEFDASLDDNLNTSRAFASLFEFMTGVRKAATEGVLCRSDLEELERSLAGVLNVLGLDQTAEYAEHKRMGLARKAGALLELSDYLGIAPDAGVNVASVLQGIIDRRQLARTAGDYALADQIRERLRAVDIALEDGADKVRYRING
jgi:cysteinyl-tRNA synthetase